MPGMDMDEPERTETSKGIGAAAETFAGLLFQRLHMRLDGVHQPGRQFVLFQIGVAGIGGDGEAGRDVQPDLRHLAQIRALAAEQHLVLAVTFFEIVNVLFAAGHGASPSHCVCVKETKVHRVCHGSWKLSLSLAH